MTAKEYLSQAYRLDLEINNKIEIMDSMHSLATKATSTFSLVPPSGTRNVHRLEDTLAKIVDMDIEINKKIDKLVDLKKEIIDVIGRVDNREYRLLLEMRYLRFMTWEEIAIDLGYNIRHIYRIHREALAKVRVP
ncbi:MAG: DUF1492 domain-containing protein [Lachnospiraceae bacterium]|nr:DUF1492 domain-containing protein [Lachnospiraceae bacterium]